MEEEKYPLPAEDRPVMMLRFRALQQEPELWKRTFAQIRKYREGWDEVWFATGVGLPPLEVHRTISEQIARAAEDLRSIGIQAGLQIQATLGHGDSSGARNDCSAKNWGGFTGKDGTTCQYCSCPRQAGFLAYMEGMAKIYAAWHPSSVWIDDDLRLSNHYPVSNSDGCYCPECLAAFSRQEGRNFTRETLLSAKEEEPELQKRWEEFGSASLCRVAEIFARVFRELSPETRMGLQHNSSPARIPVLKTLAEVSGKRAASRPGGGAYSDRQPYSFADKAMLMSYCQVMQPGYEILSQVCAEQESYPRTNFCKSAFGNIAESMLNLGLGMDSLSYFFMDPLYETPEYYGDALLGPVAKAAPCFRSYLAHNRGALGTGIGSFGKCFDIQISGLPLAGIPFCAASRAAQALIVTPQAVKLASDTELAALAEKNLLLDGPAVEAIAERGFSYLLDGVTVSSAEKFQPDEVFTDDPVCGSDAGVHYFTFGSLKYRVDIPAGVASREAGCYRKFTGESLGTATALVSRKNGRRAVILGNAGFETKFLSSARCRMLYALADWVSCSALSVLPVEAVQRMLFSQVRPDGTLASVMVLNSNIFPGEPFKLRLRGVPEKLQSVGWQIPGSGMNSLPLLRQGKDAFLEIPALAAWQAGWLKVGR